MHLGNGLSALISWLDVRKLSGEMVFRMEDLDPNRSKPHFAQWIVEDLRWLGLDWDEGPDIGGAYGPYSQSARRDLYQAHLERLQDKGLVYACTCTRQELHDASAPHASDGEPIYAGTCRHQSSAQSSAQTNALNASDFSGKHRPPAMRIAVPTTPMHFVDLNYGPQSQNLATLCGDFILKRSDGIHAYQLAVTVDDALMGITRVVRGQDLLTSVARQSYLHTQLGYQPPQYGHVPLMVGPDGVRLSKRHLATDFGYWRERGVAPEQLVGLLAYLSGLIEKPEPLKPCELIPHFDWNKLKKEHIVVSQEALNWL